MSKLGKILLVLGLLFLMLWFVSFRAFGEGNYPFVWALLGVSVACILGAVVKDFGFLKELMGQRSTKHGLNLGTLVIIVLAILVGLNVIGYRNAKKIDLTKEGLHSISEQTKNVVKALDSDLKVQAFYASTVPETAADQQKFKELMDLIKPLSSKVDFAMIDPVKKVELAKAEGIARSGTIVLEYKGKKSKIEDTTEQGFINALIKITRDKNKVIYFTTGHGELDIEGNQALGALNLKKGLQDGSYEVKPLAFTESQKVPDDASIVVIAGPKQNFLETELKLIEEYIYRGGHVLLAIDPGAKTNASKIANYVGVEFRNNYILDPLGQMEGGSAATAVGVVYLPSNDITRDFRDSRTLFHVASQVKVAKDKPEGVVIEEIVKSSPMSFTKGELKSGAIRFEEKKDEKGPITIVAVASGKFKEQAGKPAPGEFAVVVSGDADFLSNQLLDAFLNRDLALNAIAYLSKDKDLVSIRPKQAESTQIVITQAQSTFLAWGLIVFFPLGLFILGGLVWYRRRAA